MDWCRFFRSPVNDRNNIGILIANAEKLVGSLRGRTDSDGNMISPFSGAHYVNLTLALIRTYYCQTNERTSDDVKNFSFISFVNFLFFYFHEYDERRLQSVCGKKLRASVIDTPRQRGGSVKHGYCLMFIVVYNGCCNLFVKQVNNFSNFNCSCTLLKVRKLLCGPRFSCEIMHGPKAK